MYTMICKQSVCKKRTLNCYILLFTAIPNARKDFLRVLRHSSSCVIPPTLQACISFTKHRHYSCNLSSWQCLFVSLSLINTKFSFDIVPYDRPLAKISVSGVDSRVVVWVREFLAGRSQSVIGGGHYLMNPD